MSDSDGDPRTPSAQQPTRRTWSKPGGAPKPRGTGSVTDPNTSPQPSPAALRTVAILLMAQGAIRLLFLAYTMTVVISVVRSSSFWSDNPAFVATSMLSLALGLAAIVVGAGIVQRQRWARTVGVAVCVIALLGEAYVVFNLARNFASLGAFSAVLYSGMAAIYTVVFVLSLIVLVRWRPEPANAQPTWPDAP